jgi:hypothetical protein
VPMSFPKRLQWSALPYSHSEGGEPPRRNSITVAPYGIESSCARAPRGHHALGASSAPFGSGGGEEEKEEKEEEEEKEDEDEDEEGVTLSAGNANMSGAAPALLAAMPHTSQTRFPLSARARCTRTTSAGTSSGRDRCSICDAGRAR